MRRNFSGGGRGALAGGVFLGAYATVEATLGIHSELLERHRRVLPDWVALYYEEPIALVDGEGHWATDAEGRHRLDNST